MNYQFDQLVGRFAHKKRIIFKTSGTFLLPETAASPWIEYRLVGAGGSGAHGGVSGTAGGGDGGEVIDGIMKITGPTQVIIGVGGILTATTSAQGVAGTDSTLGDVIARGGVGGALLSYNRIYRAGRRGGLGGFPLSSNSAIPTGYGHRNVDGGKGVDGFGGGGGAIGQIWANSGYVSFFGSGADGGGDALGGTAADSCDAAPNTGSGGGARQGANYRAGKGAEGIGIIDFWDRLP